MMVYISTPYSLRINGDVVGFFKGKRGLRQGDPISFFVLVMHGISLRESE